MNEEIHDSSNTLLCISSQNDTSHFINLENNRRRFTAMEGEKLSNNECEKGLGSSDPRQNFSLPLLATHLPGGEAGAAAAREGPARAATPKSPN